MLSVGDTVIINELAVKGLPMRIGSRATIIDRIHSPNYQFVVEFDDGDTSPIRGIELNDLTDELIGYMDFIFTGNKVINERTGEIVEIVKANYLTKQADIRDKNMIESIVGFNSLQPIHIEINKNTEQEIFTKLGLEIGSFTDDKNKQYGSSVDATYEMMKVLMDRYTYDEDNYLIPKSLVKHMLLTVRMMDKQNRIFNNPSGKGDSESPYRDLAGYSLIGVNMVEGK